MKYKYNGQWYDLSIKALDGMPIGAIIAYPSSNIPNGWLECNGSTITSANYPELYDLIGGTLPNLKGRVIVGQDTSQTEFDTLGETGGEKTHTLDVNEMPSHTHTLSDSSAKIATINQYGGKSGSSGGIGEGTIQNTGGGQAHNNLQPYAVYKWIIKAKQTTPLMASVLNSNNASTTDTYSCDYINDLFPTDNLPVGTTAEFTGQDADIPNGWVKVNDYQTSEVDTGKTWIDGKHIYRKVIFVEELPNSTGITILTGISSVDKMINMVGMAYNKTSFLNAFPLPYVDKYSGNNNNIEITWLGTNKEVRINTSNDRTGLCAYITLEYTK